MNDFDPVTLLFSRRGLLSGTTLTVVAAGLPAPRLRAQTGRQFRPEQFGAKGDGRTDDTSAFQALGQAVSRAGGGTIVLRPRAVYRVGRQVASKGRADLAFAAETMLLVDGVRGLVIQGNGATLKLNDGLRYGAFDPATGRRFDPPAKGNFRDRSKAALVGRMIEIRDSVDLRISDLLLDGNMDGLVVGGRWGDVEIQLIATGLQLTRVSGALVEDVRACNHGLDGVYLYGRNVAKNDGTSDRIVLRRVHCDRNGRQGMSVVGGRGLRFEACVFSNTAQGPVSSRPRAGVDLEPNGQHWTTDATFDGCEFVNNRGVGLLADKGNSHTLTVRDCTFWQGFADRSGDALWLGREGVKIEDCRVHGCITHLPQSASVVRTVFDDAVHPRYGRAAQNRPYLLTGASGSFSRCTFAVGAGGRSGLIHAKGLIVLRDCRLVFAGTGPGNGAIAAFTDKAILEDMTVTEKGGAQGGRRLFVAADGATLRGRITLSGPRVRWRRPNGLVGEVGPER